MSMTDLTEFLLEFRRSAEGFWQSAPEHPLSFFQAAGVGGTSWQRGTVWKPGLSNKDIEEIEARLDLRFPQEFHQFLRVLNTTDKGYRAFGYRGSTFAQSADRPIFYDWKNGQGEIRTAWKWVLDGLIFDVQHNALWLESWGNKPEGEEAQRRVLSELIETAPALLPVSGHRCMINHPLSYGCPVISIMQADIIMYGVNLQDYLQKDFSALCRNVEGKVFSHDLQNEVFHEMKSIPFWGELIW